MLLPLLKRKELDSKTFTNDEIILGNFKGKESLPLANRGNTFVSLRGVLEVLSKTELSSDIVDNFQDEVFGHLLPYRTSQALDRRNGGMAESPVC